MKYTNFKTLALMLSASALLALTGCGSEGTSTDSGFGSTTPPPVITPPPVTPPPVDYTIPAVVGIVVLIIIVGAAYYYTKKGKGLLPLPL